MIANSWWEEYRKYEDLLFNSPLADVIIDEIDIVSTYLLELFSVLTDEQKFEYMETVELQAHIDCGSVFSQVMLMQLPEHPKIDWYWIKDSNGYTSGMRLITND